MNDNDQSTWIIVCFIDLVSKHKQIVFIDKHSMMTSEFQQLSTDANDLFVRLCHLLECS